MTDYADTFGLVFPWLEPLVGRGSGEPDVGREASGARTVRQAASAKQAVRPVPAVAAERGGSEPLALEAATRDAALRQLALRVSRGDRSAVARLYELLSGRLARYARSLTRNGHDVDDVLQAFFVRICRSPEKLARAERPYVYCLAVVRNEVFRLSRHERRRKRWERTAGQNGRHGGTGAAVRPEAEAAASEREKLVREALQKLPPEQAEVVVLKVWEQLTFAEIGEVLGESANTVASRYRYALQKLTRYLRPLAESEP